MFYFSRLKQVMIWLVVALGFIIALPNILPHSVLGYLPQWYTTLHLPMGIDLQGGTRLVAQLPPDAGKMRDDVMDIMARRFQDSEHGFHDYTITPQGKRQIRIEVPGFFDIPLLKDIVSTTAGFSLYEEDNTVAASDAITGRATLPKSSRLVYSFDDPPVGYLVSQEALLASKNIISARALPGRDSGSANLQITLDHAGSLKLRSFIAARGEKQLVAVMDGEVIKPFYPTASLPQGQLDIGPLDKTVAENLAMVMKSGPLPVDVSLVEERTVGADLGGDYARSGLMAAVAALLVVALFMIISYGLLGIVANVALAANIALLLAVLSLVGIALTLAGFAGLVLTIGISVDANILIYERIREARRNGYTVAQAFQSGFDRARGTIVDANVTVFIAALVLFLLGVGPIHGFALTVTIGILTSLFTTLTFTRLLVGIWGRSVHLHDIFARISRIIPARTHIGFMHLRKLTLGVAAIITLASLGLYMTAGMHYGIDFSGGSVAVLEARNGHTDIRDIAARANELNIDSVHVQAARNPARAFLTIGYQDMGEDAEQTVAARLRGEFDEDYTLERMDVVGPTVSETLSRSGFYAVLLSLAAIFAYIGLRFDRRFAVGAVVTTVHDIIVLTGLFVFFQWEFNLWSIAAVLAVIGYSLNDTIVVYDRIRDLLKRQVPMTIAALVDLAINRTLSRTVLTSLAALLAHIPLYYFGGPDMRNFASILLLGIVIGTYSSIFIAGPFLVLLGIWRRSSIAA